MSLKTITEYCFFCKKSLNEKESRFHKECLTEFQDFQKQDQYELLLRLASGRFIFMYLIAKEITKLPLIDKEIAFLKYCKENEYYSLENGVQINFMNLKYGFDDTEFEIEIPDSEIFGINMFVSD
jgi:hypothetical protein